MTRLRILLKMQSAEAYEMKAQALNNDPRLKQAGISAFKFSDDKNYITEGEFSPALPSPAPSETASPVPEAVSTSGGRLRVTIRMDNADLYELKAQALNEDPRLKAAGIAALKTAGEDRYLVDGEFASDLPPAPAAGAAIGKPGKSLRVVLRMADTDAYELKARALNEDPLLKEAGISALKFVNDGQYIVDGDFSANPKPAVRPGKKLRVVLKALPDAAYELVARHLNGDPALATAGVSGVGLARGAAMIPVATEIPQQQPLPVPAPAPVPVKKKRSFAGCLVAMLVTGILGVTGAGALFLLPGLLNPEPGPVATTAAVLPITGPLTPTHTPSPPTATDVPPTVTRPASTKTKLPTATFTELPAVQVVSCQAPTLGTILPGSANCRYGPGASYLYEYGLYQGDQVPILGRAATVNGNWVYVQTESEFNIDCWINADLVETDGGDIACLEDIYPETGGRPIYVTDLFPAPTNVDASRADSTVFISWTGHELALGDRESETSPRYLLELWTCQGGEIVFTPMGTFEEFASVTDEGGCSEPSHGDVYLAHKDGYIGPSAIPWP